MFEPVSTGVAITLLVKNASSWLPAIGDALIPPMRDALIGKGTERTLGWFGEQRRKLFHLDEKEQKRHLELALKNAAERGLAPFQNPEEQQQYNEVISLLSTSHADALRREAMPLLTLNDEPDFGKLNNLYYQLRSQTQSGQGKAVDVMPYLSSFFGSLVAELYADPYFRQQMSDVLHVRTGLSMQRSLTEVLSTLNQIGETLADNYTPEQFEKDVRACAEHIERTLRYLKLVPLLPFVRTNENRDPEIDGIFVSLRISKQEFMIPGISASDSLVDFLAQTSCIVLLGGPGSGKSTATRHLAWSHAIANLPNSTLLTNAPLLSGKSLPLRIELRRLNEDRRQRPDYDFLTYASEVLLGRAGLSVPAQMFELLLERRTMLVLFDGLDEVATLDDRRTLVEEIDSFARQYPGNRFLVTSRPVGYNLSPLSTQTFSKTQVQPFDDGQIHLFLENWYRHVLRLSPLLPDDLQELEELHTNLKDNMRLHALAENPLLLTVITALHRYERLPDKRIMVYDRCADLLLETWARLKGTNTRWQDLKLSKEDQYACVAHLGFVLHERSQQESSADGRAIQAQASGDLANDVPSRFILREVERFLQRQNLFPSIAERNKQASRLLDLIKEEAGLIVERGTDESGELLYGFVHRTFQEYFAAADVYERYQQEEDTSILSDFLREHLHDPHWSEVVLLLFGKLKRKPVTVQMRQILEGKIKNSHTTTQEALIFVSSCLIEEISIENDLAEAVILQLGDLVKRHSFLTSPSKALEALGLLMSTRQYALLARQEIKVLIDQNLTGGISAKIAAITILLQNSDPISEEHQIASGMLMQLVQRPDLPVKQTLQAIEGIFLFSPEGSESQYVTIRLLMELAQRIDLHVEQFIHTILNLHRFSREGSVTRQATIQLLLELTQRPNLSLEQTFNIVYNLHRLSPDESELHRNSARMLLELAQRPDLPIEQFIQIIFKLSQISLEKSQIYLTAIQMLSQLAQLPDFPIGHIIQSVESLFALGFERLEEYQMATQLLLQLTQHSKLPIEKTIQVALDLHLFSKTGSIEEQIATQMLLHLTQRRDLSIDQAIQVALNLARISSKDSEGYWISTQLLLQIAQRSDIPTEQSLQAALNLKRFSVVGSFEGKTATQLLGQLAQRSHCPDIEYTIHIVSNICRLSPGESEDYLTAIRSLLQIAQRSYIATHERLSITTALLKIGLIKYSDRVQVIQIVLDLLQKEEAIQYFEVHWQPSEQTIEPEVSDIPLLTKLSREERLPAIVRDELNQALKCLVPQLGSLAEEDNKKI